MTFEQLVQLVQQQQKTIDDLKKGTGQQDIKPDTIKMRHVGEGVRYIRSGLDAALPTTPEVPKNGVAIYFATDTLKLYVSNGSAWKSTTLS